MIYTLGGPIPADGEATSWASNAVAEPQVLKYTLMSLEQLLTKGHFPKDADINAKRENLKKALTDYCPQLLAEGVLNSCLPPVDPPKRKREFGGMYQQDDCNKNNVVNELTGGLNCLPGYTSARILRIKAPESNCGAWQNFCYKSDQTPVGFGGMYQIDDFGSVYAGNPLNAGQTSCPAGFNSHHMERSLHPEKGVGDNLFICLPSFIQDQSKIGGFYQVNDVEVVNNVDNPFTGGRSCPVNYRAVQVGRIKTPEGQQAGANVYICLLLA